MTRKYSNHRGTMVMIPATSAKCQEQLTAMLFPTTVQNIFHGRTQQSVKGRTDGRTESFIFFFLLPPHILSKFITP